MRFVSSCVRYKGQKCIMNIHSCAQFVHCPQFKGCPLLKGNNALYKGKSELVHIRLSTIQGMSTVEGVRYV